MGLDEGEEVRGRDLLLTLREEDDVHGEGTPPREGELERLDVEVELRLVVRRAAGMDAAVTDLRLEGRGAPLLERFRRLDVEVPVDEEGRGLGAGAPPLPDRYRMAGRLEELGLESRPT